MNYQEGQDVILKYLLAQTKRDKEKVVSAYDIAKQFPTTSNEVIYTLLQRLATAIPPVLIAHVRNADIHSFEAFYQPNGFTEAFIEQGGFTKQFQDEEAVRFRQQQREALEDEARIDSLRLNKDTLKLNKLNKIFLILNAAIALFTLLWTVFKS